MCKKLNEGARRISIGMRLVFSFKSSEKSPVIYKNILSRNTTRCVNYLGGFCTRINSVINNQTRRDSLCVQVFL
jgi:hypothetical protein